MRFGDRNCAERRSVFPGTFLVSAYFFFALECGADLLMAESAKSRDNADFGALKIMHAENQLVQKYWRNVSSTCTY